MCLRGGRHSARSHSRCVIQSVASFPCHTALVCAPVRELSLYPGTRQPVLRAGFALCPSHVPLTSGLWGSQLLKQCKAHYSHRSLQSAMVSQPSLGRYRPLLLALPLPPHAELKKTSEEDGCGESSPRISGLTVFTAFLVLLSTDKITHMDLWQCQAVSLSLWHALLYNFSYFYNYHTCSFYDLILAGVEYLYL